MKNYKAIFIVLTILLVSLFSCSEPVDEIILDIPSCIQEVIDENESIVILSQEVNDETQYWLSTGVAAYDGVEQIVDANCVQICAYGGWARFPCINDYDHKGWELIYP